MDNQQATNTFSKLPVGNFVSKGWFIGFLEGEGCFIAKRSKAHLYSIKSGKEQDCQVRISNTEIDLIKVCQEYLHQNYVITYILTSKRGKNKPLHELYISGTKNCAILYELIRGPMECRNNELENILGASTTTREASLDLDWLIGFYEAEGCFTLNSNYSNVNVTHNPTIIMENTNFKTVIKTVNLLHSLGLSWHVRDRTPTNPKYKCSKVVTISGCYRVRRFLNATKDLWVGYKTQRKVRLLTKFIDSRLSKDPKALYSDSEHEINRELKMKI